MQNQKFIIRPVNWGIIIGVVFIAVAFCLLTLQQGFTLSSLASIFAGPILGAGFLLLVFNIVARNEASKVSAKLSTEIDNTIAGSMHKFLHKIELARLAQECEEVGLIHIEADCSNYDYSRIISEPRQLVIVLNDGRTWASVHRDRLRRRFADPAKITTFILCHPDSPMVTVLARKGSIDTDDVKNRIYQTVKLLDEIKQPATQLEVLGHYLFNPYSVILGDDSAVIIPYFISRGGRTTPLFKYEKTKEGSYFDYIVEDVERLRMDTTILSDSPKYEVTSKEVLRLQKR